MKQTIATLQQVHYHLSQLRDRICRVEYNGEIIEATLNPTAIYKFGSAVYDTYSTDTHIRCMDANTGTWLFLDLNSINSLVGFWGIKEFYEDFIF